jgi:hypothetical protein
MEGGYQLLQLGLLAVEYHHRGGVSSWEDIKFPLDVVGKELGEEGADIGVTPKEFTSETIQFPASRLEESICA